MTPSSPSSPSPRLALACLLTALLGCGLNTSGRSSAVAPPPASVTPPTTTVPPTTPPTTTPPSTPQRPTGPTSFLSAVPPAPQQTRSGPFLPMAAGVAASAAPTAQAAPARVVEEADVYRIDGNLLYVLNVHRGLCIFDVTDLDRPQALGRLKVEGRPVDMYVRAGGTLVMLVSDTLSYHPQETELAKRFYRGSQVVVADVASPGAPRLTATLDLEGEVTGSRIVGDILYVVGRRTQDYLYYAQAADEASYIASLDVRSAASARSIDRHEFPGISQEIHVDDRAVIVAASTGNWQTGLRTKLHYLDITDPAGAIKVRGSIEVDGQVASRFQIDHRGDQLRVVTHDSNKNERTTAWAIDAKDPDRPTLSGQINIIEQEQLHAVRYDGDRCYVVTFRRIDPLFVVSYTDPRSLKVLGKLDVSGWSTHLEPRGDRLISMGVELTQGVRQAAVSIFDVRDPAKPGLLSRVTIGQGWSSSRAQSDYKAFRIDDAQGLILVPYSYWDPQGGQQNGLQLVERTGDQLKLRGSIEQQGEVQRAAPARNRLVALSDDELQIVDATDRDKPRVTHRTELAPETCGLIPLGPTTLLRLTRREAELRCEVVTSGDPDGPSTGAPLDVKLDLVAALPLAGGALLLGHDAQSQPRIQTIISGPLSTLTRAGDLALPAALTLHGLPTELDGEPLDARARAFLMAGEILVLRAYGSDEIRLIDCKDPRQPRLFFTKAFDPGTLLDVFATGSLLCCGYRETKTVPSGTASLSRYLLGRIDLSLPRAVTILPPINVPGLALRLDVQSGELDCVNAQPDATGVLRYTIARTILYQGLAYLQREIDLPRLELGRVVIAGSRALVTSQKGWTNAKQQRQHEARLHVVDLVSAQTSDAELPGGAALAAVEKDTAFLAMGTGYRRFPFLGGPAIGAPIGIGIAIAPMMMPMWWAPSLPDGLSVYDLGATGPVFRQHLRAARPASLQIDGARAWLAGGRAGAFSGQVK